MTATENHYRLNDIAETSRKWFNIEESIQDATVLENGAAVFECKVEGHPSPVAFWYKNGEPLSTNQRIKVTSNRLWHRLEITKVKLNDLGVYTLICINSTKQFFSKAYLFVVPRPINDAVLYMRPLGKKCAVTKHIRSIQVKIGGTIELEADFDEEIHDFCWFKNSEPVYQNVRTIILKSRKASHLSILGADMSDAGVYFVIAITRYGLVSSVGSVEVMLDATLVKVYISPNFEEVLPDEVETCEGEEIRLICKAVLTIDTAITWKKDGKPIEQSRCTPEEYESRYIGLRFSKVSSLDTAEYSVVLRDYHSSEEKISSCYLTVVPAPLAYVPPVEVTKPLDHVLACCGSKLALDCSFALDDPLYFYVVWYLGRYRVERTNSQFDVICNGGDFLLYIKNVEPGMCGEITCELRKALPKGRSIAVSRTVGNMALVPSQVIKEESKSENVLNPNLCDETDFLIQQFDGLQISDGPATDDQQLAPPPPNTTNGDAAGASGLQRNPVLVGELIYCRMDVEGIHFVRAQNENTADAFITHITAYDKGAYVAATAAAQGGPKTVVIKWKDFVVSHPTWYSVELLVNGTYMEVGCITSPQFELYDPPVGVMMKFRLTTVDIELAERATDSNIRIVPTPETVKKSSNNLQIKPMDAFERLYKKTGDLIGSGAFGQVVLVRDDKGELYAAKILKTLTQKRRSNAVREFEVMKKLQHPKVVELTDAFVSKDFFILVMDYLWGGELFDRIVEEEYIKEADVVPYVRQICEALEYLHSLRIAHLDLKPENIICMSPNSGQVKIIDFGLARILEEGLSTKAIYGTKEYVAPEVLNFEKLTLACDMWSLGVVTYVLLSGVNPFPGDTWPERSVNITLVNYNYDDVAFHEISDLAKDFVDKLLLLKPSNRMSAKVALNHKWITEGPAKDSKAGYMKRTRENLRSYLANYRARWQKAGNVMIAAHRLRTQAGGRTPPAPASLAGSPRVT